MVVVIILIVSSLVAGLFFEKLDRKATIVLGLLVLGAIFAYYFLKRAL